MRSFFYSVVFGIALAFLSGCETYGPHAKRGTAYGGTTGAVVGAIIGHQSDETGKGALIGAAAGGAIGTLLGSAKDQQEIEREEEIRQRQAYEIDSEAPLSGGVVIE
jgi:uncharacterized protein YcfJ